MLKNIQFKRLKHSRKKQHVHNSNSFNTYQQLGDKDLQKLKQT